MYRDTLPSRPLKRVEPFQGLMIDMGVWRDAHDYHRRQQELHTLMLHGSGIVRGLTVAPAATPNRTLHIAPGVAVDPEGRIILLAQPIEYPLNAQEAGLIYIILTFGESPSDPLLSPEDGARRPSRVLEGYAVTEVDHLPDTPYVELARLRLGAGRKPVTAADDAANPSLNEIDLRYRVEAALRPTPVVTLGVWRAHAPGAKAAAPLAHHSGGPAYLAQELRGPQWQLRWNDTTAGDRDPLDADLLLLPLEADQTLSEDDRNRLTVFLNEGGVVLAEPCTAHLNKTQTAAALDALAKALDRKPAEVAAGHPLLTAAHIFAAPPPGAASGDLRDADGLLLSQADYACAWRGGAPDKPLPREAIRTAQEFGANLLAYAQARRAAFEAGQ